MQTLIGKKMGMSSRYDKKGKRLTLTTLKVETNKVVAVKTVEKAGFNALVLGFGSIEKPSKPLAGQYALTGVPRYQKQIRVDENLEIGTEYTASSLFKVGDLVAVTGISKGKGFTGVVKRHGFAGGPKTHGQSDRHRAPGSIGSGTTPGRVYKGKRMAGRSGTDQVTVRNLIIAAIDQENDQVFVTGPVPGHFNSIVSIKKIGENAKFDGIENLVMDVRQEKAMEEKVEEQPEVVVEEKIAVEDNVDKEVVQE